ncbi:putative membrane protein YczE [Streptococcus rupicaprae]|uniref:Membrane protein YczE n=1 Tax=Streptococcus rupicaprae TaxID=759619 RepID=A0ABV2FHC9_9STRE
MKKPHITLGTLVVYLIGTVVLSLGICLSAKSNLGVSPVTSIIFALAAVTGRSFAETNFVYLCFLIFVQFLLLKKEFRLRETAQILASFLGSLFIDLFDKQLPMPEQLGWKIIFLAIGICLVGIGASLMVGMNVIPNPADALAHVIGKVTGKGFGTGKNILDIISIMAAVLVGLLFAGRLVGLGLGTVLGMIFTGRIISWFHPLTEKWYEKLTHPKGL